MFATQAQTGGTVDRQSSRLYSEEEHHVLARAAAILAVSVQDLPFILSATHSVSNHTFTDEFHDSSFSLNSGEHEPLLSLPLPQAHPTYFQPALTVNTSPGATGIISAVDNSLERADEGQISPFSWHSDSVQSSQWSPELAYHPVASERPNATTVQDWLGADLGVQAMIDVQNAPPYQGRLNGMPNTQVLYGGATFVWPGQATDSSESSYEAGNTASDQGHPGGSLDSMLAEDGAKFNWVGAMEIPPATSLGVRQHVNASAVDGQEWLGQLEGPASVGYGSERFMTEIYHREEYSLQAFADEVLQPLPLQPVPLSAERILEGLPAQCQETRTTGHGAPIANAAAIQPTQDSPRKSDTALNHSVMPAPANASTTDSISLQARARYQHAPPVSDHIAKRRKPFQGPQRVATGETRRFGACARCRMQRVRCLMANGDIQGKCLRCLELSKPTLANLPCVRYKITDSRLFDKGNHPQYRWSKRWPSWDMLEIDTWQSAEVKVITITQDVLGGSTFDIPCREFIPVEGDSLERTWKKNGVTQHYPRAPYAIASMKETGNAVARFVANNIGSSIKYYISVKTDKLLQSTYSMAYAMVFRSAQFAQNDDVRRLLQEVFQMWVGIRMESQSERICGEETLGMQPQFFDEEVDTFGTNSIPPIMSAQIELITTTRILHPMKTSILRRLQRLIQANKLRNWFGIYLCLFILLHSCSILTRDENYLAKKYGLRTRYVYNTFIEELHAGAKTMIYYFHYNNKGSHPFAKDWTSEENIAMAELNEAQARFLVETAHEVIRRKSEFEDIRKSDDFEHDFYFVAQLYDMDWKPSSII